MESEYKQTEEKLRPVYSVNVQNAIGALAMRSSGREGDWQNKGLCTVVSPDIFDEAYKMKSDIERAKEYCNACTVKEQCLAYALQHTDDTNGMIWGGLTTKEREKRKRENAHR